MAEAVFAQGPARIAPAGRSGLIAQLLFAICAAVACLADAKANVAADESAQAVAFDIPAGRLADALERFGEQSGLQIVYDTGTVENRNSPRVSGAMQAADAMGMLIANSGLSWRYVNHRTIALYDASKASELADTAPRPGTPTRKSTPARNNAARLSEIEVIGQATRTPATQTSDFALGFDKPLIETPRTISTVSRDQLDTQGVTTIEDIMRVVPGTFTTTRYDLQGGVNVRSFTSDAFYRGMKRLTLQGHARTDLNAVDSLEIVEGPPSPIYGMGAMGGYTNMMPKSARDQSGAYLSGLKGFVQATAGSYGKTEAQVGVGAPYEVAGRNGGFYLFGLFEDSDDFVEQVKVRQKILQASNTLNNFVGPFRLETGAQYSNSITSGSYMNRVTQDLISTGRYVSGLPLVNLDADGDGRIGYLDTQRNSPVSGALSTGNQPLLQYFTWPTDPVTGKPYPAGKFPTIAGIPQTMLTYLNAHPEADPTGLLRAQGAGGPLPISGQLPVGFVLDPRSVGYTRIDWHRNGAFERQQDADLWLCYFDLIDDKDPDFTLKNQLFLDNLSETKDSNLPYGEFLDTHALEEKFTVDRRIPANLLPGWLAVNSVASLNYRLTRARLINSGDDFDYRQDVMGANSGQLVPNTTFWNWVENPTVATGAPPTVSRYSSYDEFGVGAMLDIDLLRNTNLLAGGRWDGSHASSTDDQRFNAATGTSAAPGGTSPQDHASGWSSGRSWSLSLSQRLPWGLHPYVTLAHSADVLDDTNNMMSTTTITTPGGYIGNSRLKEAGIKAGLLDGKLFMSLSAYQQDRADLQGPIFPTNLVYRTQTQAKGLEGQFHWNPTRATEIYGYALFQSSRYVYNSQEMVELNARQLGFKDVVDPATGKVIYPAEAFLYGGRTWLSIPSSLLQQYEKRTGDPEKQFGLNGSYYLGDGFTVRLGGVYLSSAYLDRTQTIVLPHSLVINTGVSWDKQRWHLRLNGYNINNKLYFRARNNDSTDNTATVMPGQTYQFTAKLDF